MSPMVQAGFDLLAFCSLCPYHLWLVGSKGISCKCGVQFYCQIIHTHSLECVCRWNATYMEYASNAYKEPEDSGEYGCMCR